MLTSGLIALGSAGAVPLLNIVFHEGDLHANEGEIGVLFGLGELTLAASTLPRMWGTAGSWNCLTTWSKASARAG